MSQIIKCPKCDTRSWSSDYWTCPNCSYSESREWVLLEENKDYLDGGKGRGDEPTLLLNTWIEEQKDLTKEMINECLPKSRYNYRVSFPSNLGANVAGATYYYENDPQEVNKFRSRHAETLIKHGCFRQDALPNGKGVVLVPILPRFYYTGSQPTKIKFSKWLLTYEGSYNFNGEGYFPTVPHETAHADPAVIRHPKFQPFSSKHDPSGNPGHDDIHNKKNREFYDKLVSKKYVEKIKNRFKEYRKITNKENDKYDS